MIAGELIAAGVSEAEFRKNSIRNPRFRGEKLRKITAVGAAKLTLEAALSRNDRLPQACPAFGDLLPFAAVIRY
jgi:hypothetical protein